MIQKHVDNFLAEIAGGATPVDLNPRDSKEFWLKEIAKWTGGKSTDDASTKKIYYHPIVFSNTTSEQYQFTLSFIIIDNNPTAYTATTAIAKIADFTRITPLCGCVMTIPANKKVVPAYAAKDGTTHRIVGVNIDDNTISTGLVLETVLQQLGTSFADDVNAIN